VSQFSPSLGDHVPRGPHVRLVAAPDGYRGDPATVGSRFTDGVRAAIADLQAHGIKPAMLICDTIFSSDGVVSDPPGFLAEAVRAAQEAGALFVADEVQPGFGRTGDALWGFLRHEITPDMVTLGKPMGNGQPVAGVVMRPDVVADFGNKARYFNTFGGNPVSCAAGLAVLDVIAREGLVNRVKAVGAHLRRGLDALAARYPAIGDLRGAGLFIGAEIVSDRDGKTSDAPQARADQCFGTTRQRAQDPTASRLLRRRRRPVSRPPRRRPGPDLNKGANNRSLFLRRLRHGFPL